MSDYLNFLFVRSRDDLANTIMRSLNPGADSSKWPTDQVRFAIREGLLWIGERLRTPYPYDVTLEPGKSYMTLPGYVRGPMDVKRLLNWRYPQDGQSLSASSWEEVRSFRLYNNPEGEKILELPGQYSSSLRITYWDTNMLFPEDRMYLSTALGSSADDDIVIDGVFPGIYNGYVQVDQEIIRFQGSSYTSSTTTLHNLTRGILDTEPASYVGTEEVVPCVAAHSSTIFQPLIWWAISWLHGAYLNRASSQERDVHDLQQRTYMQLAMDTMQTQYKPPRKPKIRIG